MNSTYYWFINHGLQTTILLLLIYIPIVATIINIARYIIGTKSFGIYGPLMLTFAYIFTGIRIGLLTTAIVIFSTFISYSVLRKIRMHYISRITITYIFSALAIIMEFLFLGTVKIPVTILPNIATIPPLGIILITTLSDFFVKKYIKRGFTATMRSVFGSVSIAILSWIGIRYINNTEFLIKNFVLILILLIPINLIIGRFSGLKIKDFIRFRDILYSNE